MRRAVVTVEILSHAWDFKLSRSCVDSHCTLDANLFNYISLALSLAVFSIQCISIVVKTCVCRTRWSRDFSESELPLLC